MAGLEKRTVPVPGTSSTRRRRDGSASLSDFPRASKTHTASGTAIRPRRIEGGSGPGWGHDENQEVASRSPSKHLHPDRTKALKRNPTRRKPKQQEGR